MGCQSPRLTAPGQRPLDVAVLQLRCVDVAKHTTPQMCQHIGLKADHLWSPAARRDPPETVPSRPCGTCICSPAHHRQGGPCGCWHLIAIGGWPGLTRRELPRAGRRRQPTAAADHEAVVAASSASASGAQWLISIVRYMSMATFNAARASFDRPGSGGRSCRGQGGSGPGAGASPGPRRWPAPRGSAPRRAQRQAVPPGVRPRPVQPPRLRSRAPDAPAPCRQRGPRSARRRQGDHQQVRFGQPAGPERRAGQLSPRSAKCSASWMCAVDSTGRPARM